MKAYFIKPGVYGHHLRPYIMAGVISYILIPEAKIVLNIHHEVTSNGPKLLGYTRDKNEEILLGLEEIVGNPMKDDSIEAFELRGRDVKNLMDTLEICDRKSKELKQLEKNFEQLCARLFDHKVK